MWHDGLTPSKLCMLIFFTPRVCVGVEEDVAPSTIAAEPAVVSRAYDDEEEEKAEVEPEADEDEGDDTGHRGNRGPEEGREGQERRSGDGNGDGDGPNTLYSLWAQISLAARVGSRHIARGTAWHFGSN